MSDDLLMIDVCPAADVHGQGRDSARVRQQSCNAALPEVWLQGGGARLGFLRQVSASRVD